MGCYEGFGCCGSRKPVSRRVNEHNTATHGRAEARPGAFERQIIIPERMPRAPLRLPRHQASALCDCTRGRASARGCRQRWGVVAPLNSRHRGPDDRRLSTGKHTRECVARPARHSAQSSGQKCARRNATTRRLTTAGVVAAAAHAHRVGPRAGGGDTDGRHLSTGWHWCDRAARRARRSAQSSGDGARATRRNKSTLTPAHSIEGWGGRGAARAPHSGARWRKLRRLSAAAWVALRRQPADAARTSARGGLCENKRSWAVGHVAPTGAAVGAARTCGSSGTAPIAPPLGG